MSRPPTSSEIEHMVRHAQDDLRTAMIASSVIAGLLFIVFVALRVAARRLSSIPLGADDWWMFVSLVLFLGTPVTFAWTTKYGAGRHVILLINPRAFSTLLLIAEMLYFANIYTIKMSLLYLYRRIFPQQWFRRVLLAFGIFLTVMTLASLLLCILQCIPLHKMWDPAASGHCIDFGKFALAISCINVCTDVFMLTLPLPVIWRLKINSKKKWLVSLSFVMGGSACIVCLIRLLFVLRVASTPDPTWDSIPSGITSTFELSVGIFAASFLTYRPLYKIMFKRMGDSTAAQSSAYGRGRSFPRRQPRAHRDHTHHIIKMTNIRSETGPRETDEERLYVAGLGLETNRDSSR